MKHIFSISFIAIILFFFSCGKKETSVNPLYTLTSNTGINFTNHVTNSTDFNIFTYRNFYNGGGAAIGDINNDGLSDVLFTANQDSNRIFVNKGDWHFDDITASSGIKNTGKWGTGIVLVDINYDGWLDIYICYAGFQKGIGQENELYINNHNTTFTEKAKEYGLANTGYTTHLLFLILIWTEI